MTQPLLWIDEMKRRKMKRQLRKTWKYEEMANNQQNAVPKLKWDKRETFSLNDVGSCVASII